MILFLCRRFLNYLILTVVATAMSYFIASLTFNPRARFENINPPIPESSIRATLNAQNVNPDVSIWKRFGKYCDMVVHGNLGTNVGGHSVAGDIGGRLGVTLQLLIVGSILGAIVGVILGVLSAVKQYKFTDNAIGGFSYLALSTPVFVLAVVLEIIAVKINDMVGHKVFVYTGAFSPGLNGGFFTHLGDRISHLILPTLALMIFGLAAYSRYQRNAMLDVLGSEYIRTARAKGLTRRKALVKHGLRTALIPMSVFFAYSFGTILAGATMTEKIFGWHGMGELFLDSITNNDVNSAVAMVGFTSILILLAGMLSDIVYAALDPRVR
jgi:glutathione transport system permease protein